jgi:hypothetical protein
MLTEMGRVLIPHPEWSFAPAFAFLVLGWATRSAISRVAAGSWALYGVFELLNKYRITCSGECNIRIDLLLIYPFLIGLSGFAIARVLYRLLREPRGTRD